MRRFYKTVSVAPSASGFEIMLDAKPLRTPAKAALVLPTRRLAEAIAAEWEGQGETLKPAEMHRTQLAATAIDRVAPNHDAVAGEVAAYGGTELLCYRAATPPPLAARHHAAWQPPLDRCRVPFSPPGPAVRRVGNKG